MSQAGPASSVPSHRTEPRRSWRGWALSALVVVALMLMLEAGHRWLEARSQAPLYRVIVAGETLTLDAARHAEFSQDLSTLAAEAQATVVARLDPWVNARLDRAFAPLEAAVPDYLDWYFSAAGSYTRLGVALMGGLDPWLDEQRHRRLVEASGIEAALAELQSDHAMRLAHESRVLVDDMGKTLLERYGSRQVTGTGQEARELPALDLDGAMDQALQAGLDTARWRTAALGGSSLGLLAGRTLAKRLAVSAAGQGSRMALRALAARLGAAGARSLTTGGAAAAAAAPAGPGALAVGTVATVASVVGSEFAMLKVQEARHRPVIEARLRGGIDEARRAISASLEDTASAAAARLADGLEAQATPPEQGKPGPHPYRILGRHGP
ncbi:hypothetical protein BOX17_13625 [Halomonas aestuarii]|uniref:Uncharacterized protein n=1 Tax=Halomonas aestuarii TaxID=1897729 RepID=A0A1J0VIR4_9GAMM|nr:hypothetical protein [Halomonas aestuarii]APE31901.1 hypothetical protein BOX17_13625 [Halomonas aestuarii]